MSTKFEHALQTALSGTDLSKHLEVRGTLGGVELRPKPSKSIAVMLVVFSIMPALMVALFAGRLSSPWTGPTLAVLTIGSLLGPVVALLAWRFVLPQATRLSLFEPLHGGAGLTLAIDEGRQIAASEMSLVVERTPDQHGQHHISVYLSGDDARFRMIQVATAKPERELDALAELADLIGVSLRLVGPRQGWWLFTICTSAAVVALFAAPFVLDQVLHRSLLPTLGGASFAIVVAILADGMRLLPSRLASATPLVRTYWRDPTATPAEPRSEAPKQLAFEVIEDDDKVQLTASPRSRRWQRAFGVAAAASLMIAVKVSLLFALIPRLQQPAALMLVIGALFFAQWFFVAARDVGVRSLTTKKRQSLEGPVYRHSEHKPTPLELPEEPLRVVHLVPKRGRTGELWTARGESIQRIGQTKLSGDHEADARHLDLMLSRLDPRIRSIISVIPLSGGQGLLFVGVFLALGPALGLALVATAKALTTKLLFAGLVPSLSGVLLIWVHLVSARQQVKRALEDLDNAVRKPKARHQAGAV